MKTAVKQRAGTGVTFFDIVIVLGVISVIIAAVQAGFYFGLIHNFAWNY